jgi:S-adenosylmethionine:tRNA ribosyltransferase-isomerase
MIAAPTPVQRPQTARLLRMDARGTLVHAHRYELATFINRNDVVIANDAATLPASLRAIHERTGEPIEVRLAGRKSLDPKDVLNFAVVLFGAGNYRTRTEHRPPPPAVRVGDRLSIASTTAVIESVLGHPRFVEVQFEASPAAVWELLATHGRPIQYAHVSKPLKMWDVWTPIAASPVAYEAPSAGFALDWSLLARLRNKGARFATLTHAAGISSTGDADLDRRLPFDEPYFIPSHTVTAIEHARTCGARVIAIGTTVVRALEHAASMRGRVLPGAGIATQRIGAHTRLRVVDALLSGTHEAGTSHYELLRAFVSDESLSKLTSELDAQNYLTHEFGDSILIEVERAREYVRTRDNSRGTVVPELRKAASPACAVC